MQYLKNTTLPEANGSARNISDDDSCVQKARSNQTHWIRTCMTSYQRSSER